MNLIASLLLAVLPWSPHHVDASGAKVWKVSDTSFDVVCHGESGNAHSNPSKSLICYYPLDWRNGQRWISRHLSMGVQATTIWPAQNELLIGPRGLPLSTDRDGRVIEDGTVLCQYPTDRQFHPRFAESWSKYRLVGCGEERYYRFVWLARESSTRIDFIGCYDREANRWDVRPVQDWTLEKGRPWSTFYHEIDCDQQKLFVIHERLDSSYVKKWYECTAHSNARPIQHFDWSHITIRWGRWCTTYFNEETRRGEIRSNRAKPYAYPPNEVPDHLHLIAVGNATYLASSVNVRNARNEWVPTYVDVFQLRFEQWVRILRLNAPGFSSANNGGNSFYNATRPQLAETPTGVMVFWHQRETPSSPLQIWGADVP